MRISISHFPLFAAKETQLVKSDDTEDDAQIKIVSSLENRTSKIVTCIILNMFDTDEDLGQRHDLFSFLSDFYFVTNACRIARDMLNHWL